MRRSARRTSQIAALSAFAFLAVGCANEPPSIANQSNSPVATVTSRASDPVTSPSASSPATKPKPKATSPFGGLASYIASTRYHVTAAVYDKRTGQTWVLDPNPGVPEHTASIVKVEIMGALFTQLHAKHEDLSVNQQSLLTTMIENSDNDSATALWDQDGGASGVQSFDNRVGMTDTTASTLQWIPGSTDLPGWGWTTTTAADQVKLVKDFAYPNAILDASERSYGLSLMSHVESDQDWGVSAGAAGASVALKNGWLPLDLANDTNWQVDSIGWIHGNGRDYVLAVLCQGSTTEQQGIDTINHIAATIYSRLGAKS